MPTISRFHGITITMYWDETHPTPHFHARYAEHRASFDLAGEIIVGDLPKPQLRLVQAWATLHADELETDWDLAASEQPLEPIPPLV